jgi:hypothetical protein
MNALIDKQANKQNLNYVKAKGKSIKKDAKKNNGNSWPVPKPKGYNIIPAINKNHPAREFTILSQREKQVFELIAHVLPTKDFG